MRTIVSETWSDDAPDQRPPLLGQFHNAIRQYPQNIALICLKQDANLYGISSQAQAADADTENRSYLRWSFQALEVGVKRLKAGLESLGVRRGMAIITLLPNCAEFALTWWAAMELGAVIAPLDGRRVSNITESSHMIKTILEATNNTPPVVVAWKAEYFQSRAFQSVHVHAKIAVREHPLQYSTSLPKGIWRSHALQADLAYRVFQGNGSETMPGDLWASVVPNCHSLGIIGLVAPTLVGAGVVYPCETFSAGNTVDALVHERCTHMMLVPAMIDSFAEILGSGNQSITGLKAVLISSAPPTAQHVQTCFDVLRARGVCIRYGSTEGVACISDVVSETRHLLNHRHQLSAGRPIAGTGVKICQPGSTNAGRHAVPCGTAGEIHYSGPLGYPNMYVGQEDTDDICYVDAGGRRWFITGDEGVIDANGNLFITGRIKDIIIRGGENLSPTAIEACLAENSSLVSISIQIIAQPDPISGEAPIAIVNGTSNIATVAREIHRTVLKAMGPIWNPQEVIHISELGLDDWPKTSGGKIKKQALREILRQRYESRQGDEIKTAQSSRRDSDGSSIRERLHEIWAATVGVGEDGLDFNSLISEFADSLTIARVRGELRRNIPGLERISLQDVAIEDTLEAHIEKIVMKLGEKEVTVADTERNTSQSDVGVADMVHTIGQPSRFEMTKLLVLKAISKSGFEWSDVEAIFPAQGFVDELARNGVLDSAKFQNAYITTSVADTESGASMFDPGVALHVTMKPSEALYEHVIKDGGVVDTVEQLQQLASSHPHPEWTLLPGILFRVMVCKVKSTGTAGFVISVSHGVMDATYLGKFLEDLDKALTGPTPVTLRPHSSYQAWAESYYSLRQSPQATSSVRWHARYLNDLHDHIEKAQWPPIPQRDTFDPAGSSYGRGAHHRFCVPDLKTLRRQYPDISAPIIIKTALALLNAGRTGHYHALFSGVQAGRTAWPFMPSSLTSGVIGSVFDEATDVGGPLLQSVTNLIKISPDELVIDMLRRLQTDQQQLTQHAHAPWSDIEDALNNMSSNLTDVSKDHRRLMTRVFTSQIFNWIPGMGARVAALREPFVHFRKIASVTRWQVGLIVRAGIGGTRQDEVFLHLLGDALSDAQMEDAARE
ncbi:hypothetical protein PWT90_06614 [Aphanocladium album]|nr:hypothetical protein PWT90_06614 [Aphanocladium album]